LTEEKLNGSHSPQITAAYGTKAQIAQEQRIDAFILRKILVTARAKAFEMLLALIHGTQMDCQSKSFEFFRNVVYF
jgi:hypothetical protein